MQYGTWKLDLSFGLSKDQLRVLYKILENLTMGFCIFDWFINSMRKSSLFSQ